MAKRLPQNITGKELHDTDALVPAERGAGCLLAWQELSRGFSIN